MALLRRLVLAAAVALMLAIPAGGQEVPSLEWAVKASYLYKFAPFIDWPAAAMPPDGSPFRICVVGQDPFGATLDAAVRGQQVEGHPIVVARMDAIDGGDRDGCRIVFAGQPTTQSTAATLQALAGSPVLTVADHSHGVDGGMIEFVLDHGRVRFTVDERAASASGLQISSKLLALAVKVVR